MKNTHVDLLGNDPANESEEVLHDLSESGTTFEMYSSELENSDHSCYDHHESDSQRSSIEVSDKQANLKRPSRKSILK